MRRKTTSVGEIQLDLEELKLVLGLVEHEL